MSKRARMNLLSKLGKICQLVLLLFLLLPSKSAFSQGVPIIKNYSKILYEHDIGWSITQDKRGVMFIGVQTGIIEFANSHDSRFIKSPNSSVVRSMAVDKYGIVYVGAQKEMGFLKPNKNGLLEYQSLLSKLDKIDRNFTEVCKVYETQDGICFQTFEALYFYKDGKFKVIKASSSFHFSFYIHNVFYVLERGIGLETYTNGSLHLVPGGAEFSDDRIYSILPFGNSKLLIGTRERGLFIYNIGSNKENLIQSFAPQVSDFLVENQLYDGVKLNEHTYVFATLRSGIILMDEKGQTQQLFDKSNLLKENKVNALFVDNFGDLWIAQDNNIARLELNSPFTVLNDYAGLYGNILAITKFQDKIFVATSIGVFYLPTTKKEGASEEPLKFKQLELKTECFSFLKATFEGEEKLFVVSHLGLFEIKGNSLKLVLDDYCFFACQSKSNQNVLYVGLKNGVVMLKKLGENWISEYPEHNINDEIKSIAQDKLGNVWLGGSKEGIYKLSTTNKESFSSIDSYKLFEYYDTTAGLPFNDFNKVFIKDGNLIVGTLKGIYNFDYSRNEFAADSVLGRALPAGIETQIYDFTEIKKNEYVILSYDSKFLTLILKLRKVGDKYESLFTKHFKRLFDSNVGCFYSDSLNHLLIGSSLGLIQTDLSIDKKYNSKFNLLIKSVTIGDDSTLFSGTFYEKKSDLNGANLYAVIKQTKDFIPSISYKYNTITVKFDYAFYEAAESNQFSCYLEGHEETWKPWFYETKISYSNLSEGRYRLHLKAKNIYDTESDELIYEFVILPPWYRTIWAYIGYVLLLAGFIYVVVQLSVRRLKSAKQELENTVIERTSEIVKQNHEIQKQKDIVEIKNKDITDSINYAKRIQDTILPPDNEIKKLLPESFILFMPKDILSGDFYWIDEIDNKILVAAADCTGHGVPGALMSIVGNNILNQAINEHKISKPSEILNELNSGVTNTLRQKNEESKVKDGMDIVLLSIDKETNSVEFAGANNPLYYISNHELNMVKGDKFPIGIFIGEELKSFTNNKIQLKKGDCLYLFTDGFADQFGGPNGKKFKYNQFKITLLEMHHLPMATQREKLYQTLKSWQGENEQVDDILVIGIRL